jgi:hypothetical protein
VRLSGHLVRSGCFGIAGQHGQVLWDGDLGRRVSQTVVSAEAADRHRLEGAGSGLVQQCRDPVDGQVVGVLGVGAAGSELVASGQGDCDGVGAEEGVEVGFGVLAREDDGVDVLVHEGRGDVDLGVGVGALDGEATGQQGSAEGGAVFRHRVLFCRDERMYANE